jgi:site-specific DNA-methyltransferase (adenine-specific)
MKKTAKKKRAAAPPREWRDTLHEGDCLAGLKAVPDKSADLVFADPPFNIGRNYPGHDDKLPLPAYLEWSARWLDECVRILKPTGSLWICSSEEHVAYLAILAGGEFSLAGGGQSGFIGRQRVRLHQRHHPIWYYTFGVNCPRKLTRSHTHMLHFVKSRKQHKFNVAAVRVPSARQLVYNDKRADPKGRLPDDTWILRPQDPRAGFGPRDDVMHEPRVCGTFKQKRNTDNQMPEQLVGRVVRLLTDPGDVVVDPFAGSGTTLAVAKKLGRRYYGCEVDPGYATQIMVRLSACRPGDMLDGAGATAAARKQRRKSD